MFTTFTNKTGSINVVMVVQSLPPLPSGGAEIQALRLAEELLNKNMNIIFITPGSGKIKGYAEINGVPVYRLHSPLNYLLDLLFFIQKKSPAPKTIIEFDNTKAVNNIISRKIGLGSRLRYLIFLVNAYFFLKKRKNNFEILHSHTIEWPGYVAAVLSKWFGKKLIVKDSTMNGISNILRFPSGRKKQQLIIRYSHFVAMTKAIESNLRSAGVSPVSISRIPNGIKTDGPFKTNYQGSQKVLFIGNLYQQPAKGIDILLKAWPIVLKSLPGATLEFAGDGDLNTYRAYTDKLNISNSVTFHGKHNNVSSLMMGGDVFVLPSRREGMPNVLMEAMLHALPCVATDISGCQDLIEHGVNGLLVQPGNTDSLAENIVFMLKNRDKASMMAKNARQKILDSYSIEKVADEYVNLYNR